MKDKLKFVICIDTYQDNLVINATTTTKLHGKTTYYNHKKENVSKFFGSMKVNVHPTFIGNAIKLGVIPIKHLNVSNATS
jgi:hypothetical protein